MPTKGRAETRGAARRATRPAHRHGTDRGRAAAAGLALGCVAVLMVLAWSDVALLRDGTVAGARHTPPDEALAAAALGGERAVRASATQARGRLLQLPAVRDARVDIDLLGRYRVTLVEREAVGRWHAGGLEWFVDREGVLFSSTDPTAAPALRVTDESVATRRAGERLDPRQVEAALRLAALGPGDLRPDMRAPSVRIAGGPSGIVLSSGARWEVRFGSAERFDEKLAVVRQFLRLQPDRPLDYVDVRSPEQIVFSPR